MEALRLSSPSTQSGAATLPLPRYASPAGALLPEIDRVGLTLAVDTGNEGQPIRVVLSHATGELD